MNYEVFIIKSKVHPQEPVTAIFKNDTTVSENRNHMNKPLSSDIIT